MTDGRAARWHDIGRYSRGRTWRRVAWAFGTGRYAGQHYDLAMSEVFFAELSVRPPDHFLGASSGTHAVQTCRVLAAFEPLAAELAPDAVVLADAVTRRSATARCPRGSTSSINDRVRHYLSAPVADWRAPASIWDERVGQSIAIVLIDSRDGRLS